MRKSGYGRQAEKRRSGGLKWIYRTVVAVSAVVVMTYVALTATIQAPEFAQAAGVSSYGSTDTNIQYQNPKSETGINARKDLCYTFLIAASDNGNGNADTIMLATYNVPEKKIGLVSIPRDTIVETSRGTPKINSAYAKGMDVLLAEVSGLVGYPIDFYVSIEMDAFVRLVDQVGGLHFNVPIDMNYDDPAQHLSIHYKSGYQLLTGQQALEVARFRNNNSHSGGYPIPDVGRTETQQAILVTLAKRIISWDNILQVNDFVKIISENVETNLTLNDMLYFASEAVLMSTDNISTGTLPGDGTKSYRGAKWCYELYPEESLALLNQLVNPYRADLTLDDVNFIRAN